jgi:PTH1 family peptidyl-tRNA hydrolase
MENKLLIVGLGNPGNKYKLTRHNVGFMVLDRLAEHIKVDFEKIGNSQIAQANINGKEIYLMKPQTFMNLSGEALFPFIQNHTVDNLVIVYDDYDIPITKIRVKNSGRTTHNGVLSIMHALGNDKLKYLKDFIRIRVGIGKGAKLAEYVLENFTKAELHNLEETFTKTTNCMIDLLDKNLDKIMNEYN